MSARGRSFLAPRLTDPFSPAGVGTGNGEIDILLVTATSPPPSTDIPEPGTVVTLAPVALALCGLRRTRRSASKAGQQALERWFSPAPSPLGRGPG